MINTSDLNKEFSKLIKDNLNESKEGISNAFNQTLTKACKILNSSSISLISFDEKLIFSSLSYVNFSDLMNKTKNLRSVEVAGWGQLFIDASKLESSDINEFTHLLMPSLKCVDLKFRSDIIQELTSDVRKTLKPGIALEKIFETLKDFLELDEFYFFFREINDDDDFDEMIFSGYRLYYSNFKEDIIRQKFSGKHKERFSIDEVKKYKFTNPKLNSHTFHSKIRGREWGALVASKKTEWQSTQIEVMNFFAEQMATVFAQHDLHSESLSMAQREFLLNQITTKIRETLVVDQIIEITTQEVAQVMGVDSCGILILDRSIKARVNYSTWSVDGNLSAKMLELLYFSQRGDMKPSMINPTIDIPDASKSDDLISIFAERNDLKSFLCSGVFNDDRQLIAVVAVANFNVPRKWSSDELLLIEGISKQLEIAMIQASIYQEAQQTKRQMALLHKLSSDIRDSLDLSMVLGQLAKGLGEVLGLNRCFVRRFSPEYKILKTEKEFCSNTYTPSADMIFKFEKEWITKLAENISGNHSLQILNIQSIKEKFEENNPEVYSMTNLIKLKSYLAIPLIARGKILGTINVHQCDRERFFLPEEIEFMFRVGSEAAIAIEHASLFETINNFNKTDPDTGLYNKRYFKEVAIKQIAKCKKEGKEISFMMVDVDHLKEINDDREHGGHEAGDEAIDSLAKVLTNTVRQTPVDEINTRVSDVVGRFGGDEFMVLLPNTNIDNALIVASRIANNLKKVKHSTWPKPLTCSIGIAGTPHDELDYESLKILADKALYLSKFKGRNAISSTLELDNPEITQQLNKVLEPKT